MGAKSNPDRGSSQNKVIKIGSCLAYLRSITVTCVAGTEGLIKERRGGMGSDQRERMIVMAREVWIM